MTFLLIWFFGDLFNFTGAVLTEQIASVQVTGAYFVLTDVAIFSQYCYYKYFYKRKHALDEEFAEEESVSLLKGDAVDFDNASIDSDNTASKSEMDPVFPISRHTPDYSLNSHAHVWILVVIAASLISRINASTESPAHGQEGVIVGSVLAWASGMLYFTSRIPQIITNYRLKTADGLSLALFVLTISANLSYAGAILLRFPPLDTKFFQSILPYIIGSVGTLVFDFIILYQARLYRHPPRTHHAYSHTAE